ADVWRNQGAWGEARAGLEEALAVAAHPAVQARALTELGTVHRLQGDYAEARARHEASLALYEGLDDQQGRARTLNNLGLPASPRATPAWACWPWSNGTTPRRRTTWSAASPSTGS